METGYKNQHTSQKQSHRKRTFLDERQTAKNEIESNSDTDDIIVQIRLETHITQKFD